MTTDPKTAIAATIWADQNAHHTRDGGSETTQGDCRKGNDGGDDHDRDEPPNEVDEGALKDGRPLHRAGFIEVFASLLQQGRRSSTRRLA